MCGSCGRALEAAWTVRGLATAGMLLLTGCSGSGLQSVLSPAGPAARRIGDLWWIMFYLGAAIFLLVLVLMLSAVLRREADETSYPLGGTAFVVLGGVIMPIIVLVGLLVYTLMVSTELDVPDTDALTVEVVGHQWWWEFHYPEQDIETANEITVPVGQPVRLEVTSADVIHSLWVPRLNGKIDLIPGDTNVFWIETDEPGLYRGECAEFCGIQHAKMQFRVVAVPADSFAAWIEGRRKPAAEPITAQQQKGREVFMSSACVYCHNIDGTRASGEMGPDLTHFGSRRTIGAGILPNNRGNLGGWIVNSQAIKPGNLMPPMHLEPQELHALMAYLESLE